MEYQEIVRILYRIEHDIPVDRIEYKELKIWPLIRSELWNSLRHGERAETRKNLKRGQLIRRVWKKIAAYAAYWWFFSIRIRRIRAIKKMDAVFLIARFERTVTVDGAYYSRFSNSLQQLLTEMGLQSATLDLSRKKRPVWGETVFIDKLLEATPLTEILKRNLDSGQYAESALKHWDEFERFMTATFPDIPLYKEHILKNAEAILQYQAVYEKILARMHPAVGFLECYYHPTAMAFIRACRVLNIPTVEIQHGEQHAMYREWDRVPEKGYDTMPQNWWCWGEASARAINVWSKRVHPEHLAFVGGNPWIGRLRGMSKKQYGGHRVLVALPSKEYQLDHLWNAIRQAPRETQWYISVHPMKLSDRSFMDRLKKNVLETQNKNVEVQEREGFFYDELMKADFLLTPWSTTVYEALAFRVHPVFISPGNEELIAPYVEKKLFSLALTANEILEVITQDVSSFNFKEDVPYMETDTLRMKELLRTLTAGNAPTL